MSSTLIAYLNINESVWSFVDSTTPGESSRIMFLSSYISCIALVTPGWLPVAAALCLFKELMSEDLPTLGKPMTPTMIYCLVLPD